MKKNLVIKDERPIVLYNCDEQEIIGIFTLHNLAARYLFKEKWPKKFPAIYGSLMRKARITKDTVFAFPVTFRYANENHIGLLAGNQYFVSRHYPQPDPLTMCGFHDNAESLQKKNIERIQKKKNA